MNLIKLHKNKKQNKTTKKHVAVHSNYSLEVSGHPELLLNMGMDMSELISMDISGPLLTRVWITLFLSDMVDI